MCETFVCMAPQQHTRRCALSATRSPHCPGALRAPTKRGAVGTIAICKRGKTLLLIIRLLPVLRMQTQHPGNPKFTTPQGRCNCDEQHCCPDGHSSAVQCRSHPPAYDMLNPSYLHTFALQKQQPLRYHTIGRTAVANCPAAVPELR